LYLDTHEYRLLPDWPPDLEGYDPLNTNYPALSRPCRWLGADLSSVARLGWELDDLSAVGLEVVQVAVGPGEQGDHIVVLSERGGADREPDSRFGGLELDGAEPGAGFP